METKKKEVGEKGKGKEEGKVHAFKITKDKIKNQVSFMKNGRMSLKQRKPIWWARQYPSSSGG